MNKKHIFSWPITISLLFTIPIHAGYECHTRRAFIAHSVTNPTNTMNATVNCIQYHPTEKHLLATGSNDNTIKLWDLSQKKETEIRQAILSHKAPVTHFEWHPDKNILASIAGNEIYLWFITKEESGFNGLRVLKFKAHKAKINTISWQPTTPEADKETSLLASASNDKTAKIWTIEFIEFTEQEPQISYKKKTEIEHNDKVTHLAWNKFAPGKLATTSGKNSILVWSVNGQKQKVLCAGGNKELSSVSWPAIDILAYSSILKKLDNDPESKLDIIDLNNIGSKIYRFNFTHKNIAWSSYNSKCFITSGQASNFFSPKDYGAIDIWDYSQKHPLVQYRFITRINFPFFKEKISVDSVDYVTWDPHQENFFAAATKITQKTGENTSTDYTVIMINELTKTE